jgi:Carboxypeptidase regulatory-like domain
MFKILRVRGWVKFGLSVGCMLACALMASAQEGTASLHGTVTDADGAAVSGSRFSAILQGSDPSTQQTAANGSGNYNINGLSPGVYQIKVETAGFKTILVNNLRLAEGDSQELKFTLEAGSAEDIISIDSSEPPPDPANSL